MTPYRNIIDILTAVHVMQTEDIPDDWYPTRDRISSSKVLSKLVERGIPCGIREVKMTYPKPSEYLCWVGEGTDRIQLQHADPNMAICLAALAKLRINPQTGEKLR